MSPEQWDALQEEIHAKCVDLEYAEASDNNLANFIISLLKINMKKDKINEELTELVGSDYDPNVTDWFFTRMNELENPQQPTSTQHKDERPSGNSEAAAKTSPTGSLDSHARPEGGNRMFAQAIGSVTNGGSPSSTRRSRSRSPDHHRHRPVRERSPIRDTHAATESSPRADSERRVNFVQDGTPGSGRRSVFERLGRNAKVPPPARFDQQQHTQPMHQQQQQQQQQQSAAAAAAPAVNMMPQAAMGMPMAMGQKPIPCKFFPYCMNPACPYLHPMQMPYMMMPPQPVKRIPVPCKNGEQCKRPDCHFLHPGDENPAEIMCKYDGSCTRPNCFYKHTVPPNPQNRGNKTLVLNKMERKFAEDEAEEKIVVKESADLLKKE